MSNIEQGTAECRNKDGKTVFPGQVTAQTFTFGNPGEPMILESGHRLGPVDVVRRRYLIGSRWVQSAFWRPAANLLAQIGLFVITRNGPVCTRRNF